MNNLLQEEVIPFIWRLQRNGIAETALHGLISVVYFGFAIIVWLSLVICGKLF